VDGYLVRPAQIDHQSADGIPEEVRKARKNARRCNDPTLVGEVVQEWKSGEEAYEKDQVCLFLLFVQFCLFRWVRKEKEAEVLAKFREDVHSSQRVVARQEGMPSKTTIQRILKVGDLFWNDKVSICF
jgi:hypothetical protein